MLAKYRIKSRSQELLKVALIVTLLSFSITLVHFLPQLITPQILNKNLSKLTFGEIDVDDLQENHFDFVFEGTTNNFSVIENFNNTLKQASISTYNQFCPKSSFHGFYDVVVERSSNSTNWLLVGTSHAIFSNIVNNILNKTSIDGALIITSNLTIITGLYNFNVREESFNLSISNNLSLDIFRNHEQILSEYLFSGPYTGIENIVLLPVQTLDNLYRSTLELDQNFKYNIFGYLSVDESQKSELYWSVDKQYKKKLFQRTIISNLQKIDSKVNVIFTISSGVNSYDIQADILINLVYSIVRCMQLVVWIISLVIMFISITKLQELNKYQELNQLLVGQSWKGRIGGILIDSLLLCGTSTIITAMLFFPLMYSQNLLSMQFQFTIDLLFQFILLQVLQLVIILCSFLAYEFHLRKIQNSKIAYDTKYQFSKDKFIRIIFACCVSLLILNIFLQDKYWVFLIMFFGVLLTSLFISGILYFILLVVITLSEKLNFLYLKWKDKPLSSISCLFILWKKKFKRKNFLFLFLFTLISSTFIYSNATADINKTNCLFDLGGEINLTIYGNATNQVIPALSSYDNIESFTIKKFSFQKSNGTGFFNYGIIENKLHVINRSDFSGSEIFSVKGIDFQDYFEHYSNWNKKNWLDGVTSSQLDNRSILLSNKLRSEGFSKGDNLLINNDSLIVAGFFQTLPSIGTQSTSDYFSTIICDISVLTNWFQSNNINNDFASFIIRTSTETTLETIEYLNTRLSSQKFELSYLDPEIYSSVNTIFLKPLAICFEAFILIFLALILFSLMRIKNQSGEVLSLSLIAIRKNYRKPFWNYSLIENGAILLFGSIIFFIFNIAAYRLQAMVLISESFFVSGNTIQNYAFLFVGYFILLLIQQIAIFLGIRKLDLAMIFRHPE